MKKKTQRSRVPVTLALPENWSVPIRRCSAGSTRQSRKATVRIIRIGKVNEHIRLLVAPAFDRSGVIL